MSKKNDMIEINDGESKVSLADFVSEAKIRAFTDTYQPADCEGGCTEVFTDIRLREYFKCYVCSLGDPLNIYLDRLETCGFRMRTSMVGEPAIFAVRKYIN